MSETISEKLKCARNSSARRLIVEAQNIVKERYMEADISLDEVCAVLGVSNSYFSSVFKNCIGFFPHFKSISAFIVTAAENKVN